MQHSWPSRHPVVHGAGADDVGVLVVAEHGDAGEANVGELRPLE